MKLGDPTAKMDGRLSLNPLHHLDPIGALCLLLFRFGWAKPVPINPGYFKHPRRDMALVSLAGAAGNILTAFVCAQFVAFPRAFPDLCRTAVYTHNDLHERGACSIQPSADTPLDGSRVLYVMLPYKYLNVYYTMERYGMFVIVGLMIPE